MNKFWEVGRRSFTANHEDRSNNPQIEDQVAYDRVAGPVSL